MNSNKCRRSGRLNGNKCVTKWHWFGVDRSSNELSVHVLSNEIVEMSNSCCLQEYLRLAVAATLAEFPRFLARDECDRPPLSSRFILSGGSAAAFSRVRTWIVTNCPQHAHYRIVDIARFPSLIAFYSFRIPDFPRATLKRWSSAILAT